MTEEKQEQKDKKEEKKKYEGPPKVIDVLQNYIVVLGTLSLQYMGVLPNPDGTLDTSGKKDLLQAKTAIDSMSVLFKQIEDSLDKTVKDNIGKMLSEVQLKYVHEKGKESK